MLYITDWRIRYRCIEDSWRYKERRVLLNKLLHRTALFVNILLPHNIKTLLALLRLMQEGKWRGMINTHLLQAVH